MGYEMYLMPVPRKIAHITLLVLLAVLQAVQGAFAGTTLCREESGKVVLEWAEGGQCESAWQEGLTCINKASEAASEHCQMCLDLPLPSEKSLKSIAHSSEVLWIPTSTVLEFLLPVSTGEHVALPALPSIPAHERLSSIRLLI